MATPEKPSSNPVPEQSEQRNPTPLEKREIDRRALQRLTSEDLARLRALQITPQQLDAVAKMTPEQLDALDRLTKTELEEVGANPEEAKELIEAYQQNPHLERQMTLLRGVPDLEHSPSSPFNFSKKMRWGGRLFLSYDTGKKEWQYAYDNVMGGSTKVETVKGIVKGYPDAEATLLALAAGFNQESVKPYEEPQTKDALLQRQQQDLEKLPGVTKRTLVSTPTSFNGVPFPAFGVPEAQRNNHFETPYYVLDIRGVRDVKAFVENGKWHCEMQGFVMDAWDKGNPETFKAANLLPQGGEEDAQGPQAFVHMLEKFNVELEKLDR